MGEVIAAYAVMFLEMADDGLNGGTAFELALDLRREAALLAACVACLAQGQQGNWNCQRAGHEITPTGNVGKRSRERSSKSEEDNRTPPGTNDASSGETMARLLRSRVAAGNDVDGRAGFWSAAAPVRTSPWP
jgi:hypothetical protein